jgi:hypothetical protein
MRVPRLPFMERRKDRKFRGFSLLSLGLSSGSERTFILRRSGGRLVAAFTPQGATQEGIIEAAQEDYRQLLAQALAANLYENVEPQSGSRRWCRHAVSPTNVDPTVSEFDQSLSVPLAVGSLALVEGSGFRGTAQAGKLRLVQDPLEDLVASSHPAVAANPLAGRTVPPGVAV